MYLLSVNFTFSEPTHTGFWSFCIFLKKYSGYRYVIYQNPTSIFSLKELLAGSNWTFSRPGPPAALRLRLHQRRTLGLHRGPLGRPAQAQSGRVLGSQAGAEGPHLSLQGSCQRPPRPPARPGPSVPGWRSALYLYRWAQTGPYWAVPAVQPASCPAPPRPARSARPPGQVTAPSLRPLRSRGAVPRAGDQQLVSTVTEETRAPVEGLV